jgi:putative addiction module killer protein
MFDVRQTDTFRDWLTSLRDRKAQIRIDARIVHLRNGHFGDARPVGEGLSELRIHHGPGYRLYLVRIGATVVVLLCGGDKSTQDRDIAKAKEMARILKEEPQ